MSARPISDVGLGDASSAFRGFFAKSEAPRRASSGYRAYIAYSPRDAASARWLKRRLEGFEVPPSYVGRETAMGPTPETLAPICREPVEVGAGGVVSDAAKAALDASKALIVICSPDSAVSEHVNNVVKYFRSRHPERPVAPLVTRVGEDGRDASFPLALRFAITASGELAAQPMEVVAADLREAADGPDLALAKVVASLIAADPDDLFQRAQRAQRRRQRAGIAGLGAAAVLMSALALWADGARRDAEDAKVRAEALELRASAAAARRSNAECALTRSLAALSLADRVDDAFARPFRDDVRNILSETRVVATLGPTLDGRPSRAAIDWLPGGDTLVLLGAENKVRAWSEASGALEPYGALTGRTSGLAGALRGFAFSRQGDRLAVLRDTVLEIWTSDARRRLRSIPMQRAVAVSWSPTDERLVVVAENAGVYSVEPMSGETTRLAGFVGLDGRGVAFSPDGSLLAVGAETARVDIQSAFGPDARSQLPHPASVIDVDWSAKGDAVAVALENGQVYVWNPVTGRRVETLDAHAKRATAVAFSPDGAYLATASVTGEIKVWSADSWAREATMTGHSGGVSALRWRADGGRLASVSEDGTARIWSWREGRGVKSWSRLAGWVWDVAWPGEGERLAAVMDTLLVAAPSPEAEATRVAFSEQYLAGSAAVDAPLYAYIDSGSLAIRDLAADRVVFQQQLDDEIGRPLSVAIAPDGAFVAVGSLNGVFVWSVADFKQVAAIARPSVALAFSPDNARLAHYDLSGAVVRVVEPMSGEEIASLAGPPEDKAVWGLAWSRRGDRLAAASDDGKVHLWRFEEQGAPVYTPLAGHEGDVKDVAWSPGDRVLASASLDGTVRLWDPRAGAVAAVLDAHRSGVRSLAWSGDGRTLATGGEDGAVRLFTTGFREILTLARAQREAGSTDAERRRCLGRHADLLPDAR